MDFGENQKGKTFAFMTFSPFKSFWHQVLKIGVLHLAHARQIQEDVKALEFLHFAHFIRVTPQMLRRAGIPTTGRLRHGGFLFNSAYNGDAQVYFRGFSEPEAVREHMNDLWKGSVGWVNAFPYELLQTFIGRYHRSVNARVNSYPSFTLGVRAALEVRDEVHRLTVTALSNDEDEFEKAFRETAMRLWGNAA